MTPLTPLRRLALSGAILVLVAACGASPASPSPTPAAPSVAPSPTVAPTPAGGSSAAPSGQPSPTSAAVDPAPIYDRIEDQVVALRDLDKVDVRRETIDAAALKQKNAERFDRESPPDYVAGNEAILKSLGLIPTDASLRQLYLDLIDSQVVGFYEPDEKALYVVSRSGTVNGPDKITFAHEYDHALQDANFQGLFAEQKDLLDQSDQALARASVYEGDATLLMTQWAIPNLTPAELAEYGALASDPAATEVLARTPQFLIDGLTIPYNAGLSFLVPMQSQGGWAAVDKVYRNLPASTEQVLHPDKYAAGEAPVKVTIPTDDVLRTLGSGWNLQLQDTFGEFQIRSWLAATGVPGTAADAAAAGWGGDRLAVFRSGTDDAAALVMHTVWDTAADAQAFEDAAQTAIRKADGSAGVFPGAGGKTRWVVVAGDDATLEKVAGALGLAG